MPNLQRRNGRSNRRRILHAVVWGTCLGLCLGTALADGGTLSYRKVALTGEEAPGTEAGTYFSIFTTGLNHSIMAPQIDADGRVAFIALVDGPGVGTTGLSGIWAEDDGALSLVVRTGMQAPGAPQGVTFAGVPSEYLPFPPSFAGGRALFQGVVTGPGIDSSNNDGVWTGGVGGLQLVAREGSQAPGQAAGVTFGFLGGTIDEGGASRLTVDLAGTGVTSTNNDSIWTDRSGALELLLREGDPAPGTGGAVFGAGNLGSAYVFTDKAFNEDTDLAVQANLLGSGVDAFNDETVMFEDPDSGHLALLGRDGDPVPQVAPDAYFGGGSVSASFGQLSHNTQGDVAFLARVGGPGWLETVMFSNRSGDLEWEVRSGFPAPGTGADFTIFGGPVLNDAGRLAFRGSTATGNWPPMGIFWDQAGETAPLVLPGDQVAGMTITGTSFIAGYNDDGELGFTAGLEHPQEGFKSGLVLSEPDGTLHLVAATGDQFDVQGDGSDLREIVRIQHGGLSDNGVVAFRLDFTDGSSGHFAATLRVPGEVEDLRLGRNPDGTLALSWTEDCAGGSSYGIYRGDLAVGVAGMAPVPGQCALDSTTTTLPDGILDAEMFLVVPNAGGFEGSHGIAGDGQERQPMSTTCYPAGVAASCGP